MRDVWLMIETSANPLLGLSAEGTVVAERQLPSGRRHNRELMPAIELLLKEHGIAFADLAGIRVGTGPGSYTGLRIGITAAKALAYALDKPLVAVPSYRVIAHRSDVERIEVIGDALNRTVYVQRFGPKDADGMRTELDAIHIEDLATFIQTRDPQSWIGGPGAATFASELPAEWCVPAEMQSPDMSAMEHVGRHLPDLAREAMMALEPLYLRGSSAEEKAKNSATD
jgi:tRNA threonylcarbamoyladenosine biosynthesis protein TsaB